MISSIISYDYLFLINEPIIVLVEIHQITSRADNITFFSMNEWPVLKKVGIEVTNKKKHMPGKIHPETPISPVFDRQYY